MPQGKANPNSEFYPYIKVYEGYSDFVDELRIPRKVMDYLLDMPDDVYTPVDDNKRARTRLWKYLYYDGAHPEQQPLPTPSEKMDVLFDPEFPTRPPNSEKGYRLFPQVFIKPSQTDAQTRIYVYMGRPVPTDDFTIQLSVVFDIFVHYTEEANTREDNSYSRAEAISQAIRQALHGVNMDGVGSFYFNRARHADCTDEPFTDKDSNVGRHLVMGLEIKSTVPNEGAPYNDIPINGWGVNFG